MAIENIKGRIWALFIGIFKIMGYIEDEIGGILDELIKVNKGMNWHTVH